MKKFMMVLLILIVGTSVMLFADEVVEAVEVEQTYGEYVTKLVKTRTYNIGLRSLSSSNVEANTANVKHEKLINDMHQKMETLGYELYFIQSQTVVSSANTNVNAIAFDIHTITYKRK